MIKFYYNSDKWQQIGPNKVSYHDPTNQQTNQPTHQTVQSNKKIGKTKEWTSKQEKTQYINRLDLSVWFSEKLLSFSH